MEDILAKAKKHCAQLLRESRCSSLPFHNHQHTTDVYENVLIIGLYERKDLKTLEPALLAALFHDTGNAKKFLGHEDLSIKKAIMYLKSQKYTASKIEKVIACINATRMPQTPLNSLEKIICDADLFHLGTTSYLAKNQLLRNEWAQYRELEYSDAEWIALNISFLKQHRFHTNYGREILQPIKQHTIDSLTAGL